MSYVAILGGTLKQWGIAFLVCVLAANEASDSYVKSQAPTVVRGGTFLTIEVAAKAFRDHPNCKEHQPDMERYAIEIGSISPQRISVLFKNRGSYDHHAGNTGPLPEFKVELDPFTRKILRSGFVR